ncbi:somatomedin-B and thrombospondin type-1 domain-containing protein-like protein, partial [Dinothrombium tinctorium]
VKPKETKFTFVLFKMLLKYFTFGVIYAFVSLSFTKGQQSCKEAQLCCPGRDSSCVVQKTKANAIIEDIDEDKGCYCDHACMTLGDCCSDYKEACGVIDCELSEWGQWSECDVECGLGTMSRKRKILREPQNGGKECEELQQKRGCHGHKCESRATAKASRESALILPSTFLSTRTINATLDLRKNILLRYPKDPLKEKSHDYCVVFEVTKTRKGCDHLGEAMKKHSPGNRVCVICELAAMRKHLGYRCLGHGVDDRQTRWTLLSNPDCHGRWIRRSHHNECPCHSDGHPDFIFV